MPDTPSHLRVTSVIASLTAGGIGPVCRYAAEGMSRLTEWDVTLLSLHDPIGESKDEASGLRTVCLGLDGNCARLFLDWLLSNPQDVLITGDVSRIEQAFPFLPSTTRHIVQIHDSGRRYRDVAVRNQAWIDGVTCVGQHFETPLRNGLNKAGFRGLLRAIHNGAEFPLQKPRPRYDGSLRLLFMGRMEALKGIFDFVPILRQLKKRNVPVSLNLVGGENDTLRRRFQRYGLDEMVTWTGWVSHAQCYEIAAQSDIFLMTSRKESFGMVTIEAMSMGCVPIAYDVPSGSTEIISNEQSGLLVPLGDYKAWATAIETLHQDRERLSRLSIGAIERARSSFNSGVMAGNMVGFVRDVMSFSEDHRSLRKSGKPLRTPEFFVQQDRGYQRLPAWLRLRVRNWVGSNPRVCHWLLNR